MTVEGTAYAAALALAALLVVAAVAKLRSPDETRRSFHELGVPNAEQAARLVPLPELAAAALLVVVPAVGGIAALMLLAFFSTFIVSRLRAGVVAPCACFGAAHARPLSWVTLARNAALALLALASVATTRPVRPSIADVAVVLAYVGAATVLVQLGGRLVPDR